MTKADILLEIRKEIQNLREEVIAQTRPILTTKEACSLLGIKDARILNIFFDKGVLTSRYGGTKCGYKWSRGELMVAQAKLLFGEIQLPKIR